MFHDSRAPGANNETLDLYASGSLVDAFGNALTMAAIKLLYIKNTHASLVLAIGGGADVDLLIFTATSDIVEIQPGGFLLWACPTAAGVVTSTNKNLKVADKAAGTNITYDVVALGLD